MKQCDGRAAFADAFSEMGRVSALPMPRAHPTSEDARWRRKRRNGTAFAAIRIAELNRLFSDRYRGPILPDDDAGFSDAEVMLHHLAHRNCANAERLIGNWIEARAPWLRGNPIIAEIIAAPRRFKADMKHWCAMPASSIAARLLRGPVLLSTR